MNYFPKFTLNLKYKGSNKNKIHVFQNKIKQEAKLGMIVSRNVFDFF